MFEYSINFKQNGRKIVINNFPLRTFQRAVRKNYNRERLLNIIRDVTARERFFSSFMSIINSYTIEIDRFFLPELIYLLRISGINSLIHLSNGLVNIMVELNRADQRTVPFIKPNLGLMANLKKKPFPYQKTFIEAYPYLKRKMNLRGYLLSFQQGLGKTITGLSLYYLLKKKVIVIICMKRLMHDVWESEILELFNGIPKNNIYTCDKVNHKFPYKASKKFPLFLIYNYENISKIEKNIKSLRGISTRDVAVIVDESQNFLSMESRRTTYLRNLVIDNRINDLLLLSGTPIKAMGIELLSVLALLDRSYHKSILRTFKDAFGVSKPVALDILRNRLNLVMYRKTKEQVMPNLPKKHFIDINVDIPNPKKYTLEVVKKDILEYAQSRLNFYDKKISEYGKKMEICFRYLESNPKLSKLTHSRQYKRWKRFLQERYNNFSLSGFFTRMVSGRQNLTMEEFKQLDDQIIIYFDKKHFKLYKEARSVLVYLGSKVLGEAMGKVLIPLRAQLLIEMIDHANLKSIINQQIKKTLIFTSSVKAAKHCKERLEAERMLPLLLYGGTKDAKHVLNQFRTQVKYNPLIATIQTIGAGVTLIEANCIIFLNPPWRDTTRQQAIDRIHRIGQDTDVYIYSLRLDTGSEPNILSRMDDILKWSKQMFEGIVDINEELKDGIKIK